MSIEELSIGMHPNIEHGIQIFYHQKYSMLYSLHGHNFYEIFFVTNGNAMHRCNNELSKLSRGSIVLIRPDDIHQYLDTSEDFSFYNLVFSKETAEKIFSLYDRDIITNLITSKVAPHLSVPANLVQGISNKFTEDIETTDLQSRSFFNVALLTSLIPLFIQFTNSIDDIPLWFQELLDIIDRNKNYTKGLSYLYSVATRSKEHVSRNFKKLIGVTPTEYINNKKLNYSSNLLKQTNYEIVDISQMAGFNSHSHFYHLFKEKFNMSPREYRLKGNSLFI